MNISIKAIPCKKNEFIIKCPDRKILLKIMHHFRAEPNLNMSYHENAFEFGGGRFFMSKGTAAELRKAGGSPDYILADQNAVSRIHTFLDEHAKRVNKENTGPSRTISP